MTELAVPADTTPTSYAEVPAPPPQMNSALVQWAYEARQAAQIATSLSRTSFVPVSMRDKPEDVTAAILAGQELGLQPMSTLRSMDVIQGTPALRAHAMRGLVQSHGHSVQMVESTEARCVIRGRRKGDAEWQTVTWTIERATRLRLTNKPEWVKQPQTMLVNRATGEICRLIASDVLFAMPYASEELDEEPATEAPPARVTTAEVLNSAPAALPRALTETPTAAAPEPPAAPVEEPAAPPTEPAPEHAAFERPAAAVDGEPPVSRTQRDQLHALLDTCKVTARKDKLDVLGKLVGHRLVTADDLTHAQADGVITLLKRLAGTDDPDRGLDQVLAELPDTDQTGGA